MKRLDADQWLLVVAMAVAVASASAVAFFSARIEAAMAQQAGEAIAADLRTRDSQPVSANIEDQARGLGLRTARTVTFPSVVIAGEASSLAGIKAVSDGYPLRGELRVADQPYGPESLRRGGPAPGEAWVDPRVYAELNLALGESVQVGQRELVVTQVLAYEPDRGGGFTTLAPRLMLHIDDLSGSGLLGPGSRARYALLVAGPADALARLRETTAEQLASGQRWTTAEQARPELDDALGRARRFMGLAALSAVLLAGVAMALSAVQYAAGQRDAVALRKTLGATGRMILRGELLRLLRLGVLGGLIGLAFGYLGQWILVRVIGDLVLMSLPPPPLWPALPALATGAVALIGFGLPPLLRLRHVPPMRVLQQALGPPAASVWGAGLVAATTVAGLLIWQAGDLRLALTVFVGAALALGALALAALGLTQWVQRLRHRSGGAWRYGLANIARRRGDATLQLVAVGTGLTVLLLLVVVRGDLLATWRDSLPEDAPNVFLINIQSDQRDAVSRFFADRGLGEPTLHAMARGRLIAVNGDAVEAQQYDDPDARERLERAFNLSWATELGDDNTTIDGQWWGEDGRGQPWISIEENMVESYGWTLGDRLSFDFAGQTLDLEVVHRRAVEWDSFSVNFFLLVPPGLLDEVDATWLTSVHLPPEGKTALLDLVRAEPNITVLDVDALIAQVRRVMDRVSLAVEAVFALTLLAGLVVLMAALQGTRDQRRREAALLRTLGASRRVLRQALFTEFGVLGALSGLLAAGFAQLIAAALARGVFDMTYVASPDLWWTGPLAGMLLMTAAAVVSVRGVVGQPPLATLR
ncbi:MAG: hypothetical protein CMH65_14035 [Nevskiales bacterium]|nr:hypothetical protein [Nevskiales bacterium]